MNHLGLDGNNRAMVLGPPGKCCINKIWPVSATNSLPHAVRNAPEVEQLGRIGRLQSLELMGRLRENILLLALSQLRSDSRGYVDGFLIAFLNLRFGLNIDSLAVRETRILEAVQIRKVARLRRKLNAAAFPLVQERGLKKKSTVNLL